MLRQSMAAARWRGEVVLLQRRHGDALEQPAVEPGDGLVAVVRRPAWLNSAVSRFVARRIVRRLAEQAGEQAACQQAFVLGEHTRHWMRKWAT
ncbi:MAG: hypothetical protein R3E40_07990 [Rhodocyclaceae bacterium]